MASIADGRYLDLPLEIYALLPRALYRIVRQSELVNHFGYGVEWKQESISLRGEQFAIAKLVEQAKKGWPTRANVTPSATVDAMWYFALLTGSLMVDRVPVAELDFSSLRRLRHTIFICKNFIATVQPSNFELRLLSKIKQLDPNYDYENGYIADSLHVILATLQRERGEASRHSLQYDMYLTAYNLSAFVLPADAKFDASAIVEVLRLISYIMSTYSLPQSVESIFKIAVTGYLCSCHDWSQGLEGLLVEQQFEVLAMLLVANSINHSQAKKYFTSLMLPENLAGLALNALLEFCLYANELKLDYPPTLLAAIRESEYYFGTHKTYIGRGRFGLCNLHDLGFIALLRWNIQTNDNVRKEDRVCWLVGHPEMDLVICRKVIAANNMPFSMTRLNIIAAELEVQPSLEIGLLVTSFGPAGSQENNLAASV